MIDKTKLHILRLAEKEQKEGETLLDAASRLMAFVSDAPSVKEVKKPKARKPEKPKFSGLNGEQKEFLEALILLKEAGERVSLKSALEMLGKETTYPYTTGILSTLLDNGYLKKQGDRSATRWTILKSADGADYLPKPVKVESGKAHGYGDVPRKNTSTGRPNAILRAMGL